MAFQLLNRAYTIGTVDGSGDITPGVAQDGFNDYSGITAGNETYITAFQGLKWAYIKVLKTGAVLRPQTTYDGSSGEGNSVSFDAGAISVITDIGKEHIAYVDGDGKAVNAAAFLKTFSPVDLNDATDGLKVTPIPASGKSVALLQSITAGDKKGALYIWDPDETAAGDDFKYVVSTLSATGRWVRQETILEFATLSADADAFPSSLYQIGDDLRAQNATGVAKRIPRVENFIEGSYATIAALLAVSSTQGALNTWPDGAIVEVRGIAVDGDIAQPLILKWDADDNDETAALGVSKWRPDDITGSNDGRWNMALPNKASKFADSDATPDVSVGELFVCADTAPGAITGFTNFRDGKWIVIEPGAQDQVFDHSAGFEFPNAQDFTLRVGASPIFAYKNNGVIKFLTGGGSAFTPNNLPPSELTIASGAITIDRYHHSIDTEADAASDILDTINWPANAPEGTEAVLYLENAARTVTVQHGTGAGEIETPSENDIELEALGRFLKVVKTATGTRVVQNVSISIGGGNAFINLDDYIGTTGSTDPASVTDVTSSFNSAMSDAAAANKELVLMGYTDGTRRYVGLDSNTVLAANVPIRIKGKMGFVANTVNERFLIARHALDLEGDLELDGRVTNHTVAAGFHADSYALEISAGEERAGAPYGTELFGTRVKGLRCVNWGNAGVQTWWLTDVQFEDCYFDRIGARGIRHHSAKHSKIINCRTGRIWPGTTPSALALGNSSNAYGFVHTNWSDERQCIDCWVIDCLVEDVWSWTGIDFHNTDGAYAINNNVLNCANAIGFESHQSTTAQHNIVARGNRCRGFDNGTGEYTFDSVTMYQRPGISQHTSTAVTQTRGVNICDNVIELHGEKRPGVTGPGAGINARYSRSVNIANNVLIGSFQTGIYLRGLDNSDDYIFHTIIQGNNVDGVTAHESIRRGIVWEKQVKGFAKGNIVAGPVLADAYAELPFTATPDTTMGFHFGTIGDLNSVSGPDDNFVQ